MHFRDHPLLKHGKVNTWPPVWVNTRGGDKKVLRGEVGVLREVIANNFTGNKCFLVIDNENENYVGTLFIDDPAFCRYITRFLQGRLGQSIKSIGDSDITASL